MAISDTISSIEDNIRADYKGLTNLGIDLTGINKNIENIKPCLDTIWNNLPKVSDTGTEVTLSPTLKGKLGVVEKGNSTQETTQYIDVGTWEQGGIDGSSGISTVADTQVRTADYIEVKPNVLYKLTRSIATSYMNFRFYNSSKTYLGGQTVSGMATSNRTNNRMDTNQTDMEITIINTNVAYMKMVDNSNNTSTVYTLYTEQTPSPIYPQAIKSVTGENEVVVRTLNLFNINDLYQGQYDGGIKTSHPQRVCTNGLIKVIPNTTYYINLYGTETKTSMRFKITYFDKNKNFIADAEWQYITLAHNFTTDINAEYIGVSFIYVLEWSVQNLSISEFQTLNNGIAIVSKGSTATDYTPYQNQTLPLNLGNIELNKIGNYQDYIFKQNGNWYKHEEIGKATLDSTNYVERGTTGTNAYFIGTNIATPNNNNIVLAYCNMFQPISFVNRNNGLDVTYSQNGLVKLRTANNTSLNWNNATNSKNWLDTNTPIVYYIKSTETDIEITDTQLVEQLNEIDKMQSYNGTIIITSTYDTNNAQMILQVSSLKGE